MKIPPAQRIKIRGSLSTPCFCRPAARLIALISPLLIASSGGATITFIGGNTTWTDGLNNSNFNPPDEPDPDDDFIFSEPNTVPLGSSNSVASLAMSNGISIDTAGFDLTIDGLFHLADAGTDITVNGGGSSISADDVSINNGAVIELRSGVLSVADETGTGLLDINAGGILRGQGTITLADNAIGAPTALLSNNGTIHAVAPGLVIGSPPAGTLTINAVDATNARLNLDGTSPESGALNVSRNQTLDINVLLADGLNGTIDLGHNATLDIASGWTLSGGTLDADNGFVNVGNPIFNIPASTSFISGGAFHQAGGTITVTDTDGRLQFNAPFTQSDGVLDNFGEVVFNADATIGVPGDFSSDFDMASPTARLTVNPGVEVNIDQPLFRSGGSGNVITIGSGGILDIDIGTLPELPPTSYTNDFENVINLNGGELDVTSEQGGHWLLSGIVNVGASTGTSQINGETVVFHDDLVVTVGASSILNVNTNSNWKTGAALSVGSGATANLNSPSFNAPGTLNGPGRLRVNSSSSILGNTTFATDILDWDGNEVDSLCTIANGVSLAINTTTLDTDGEMDDNIDLGGNGASLSVSGLAEWRFNRTLNANTAVAGTATIGGTSRMILREATGDFNVKGNTIVAAPITFGDFSTTTVDPGATLTVNGGAIYDGAVITGTLAGEGRYNPPVSGTNQVTKSSDISTASFNFDRGSWTIDPGAILTVKVEDYEPDSETNVFDNTVTITSGSINVTSDDGAFVMDGTVNLDNTTGTRAIWSGDALEVGNDAGISDADLNVGGSGFSEIESPVTFLSDASVNIGAGAILRLGDTANFNGVNGANNAVFTGAGTLVTNGEVNVNEATTLNMAGGTVDLDGTDNDESGAIISVSAPLVINASMSSFGKTNSSDGKNVLDIDSNGNSGFLSVNSEWTLNAPGVMNLENDASPDTALLAGAPVNLNGALNVLGNVSSDARVKIGSTGVINIKNAGATFRLSGGDLLAPNTIAGGTINGPGSLGTTELIALTGFGTIAANADIDFDGFSDLLANDGILTINSSILDVRNIGTADSDGTLRVPHAWTPPTGSIVLMQGGSLQGGTVTLNNAAGMTGHGAVTAPVINNTLIHANIGGETLALTSSLNDWDGTDAPLDGILRATNGGTLQCNSNGVFPFRGTINAADGGTVSSNGFAFILASDSKLILANNGTYKSTGNTLLQKTVTVGSGADSRIEGSLDFDPTSTTTLTGNLVLDTDSGIISMGATFGGTGTLKIAEGSTVIQEEDSNINVLVGNAGRLIVAGSETGLVTIKDFQQTASGVLEVELDGTNFSDRLKVVGTAVVGGKLQLKFVGGYTPDLGDEFDVITDGSIFGTFDTLIQPDMPAGKAFAAVYLSDKVRVKVVASSTFDAWVNGFSSLTNAADKARTANPDGDALDNLGEFALDGDPSSGAISGKIFSKIAPVGGISAMTLTLAVRNGAVPDPADPAGGEFVLKQSPDGLTYRIQASDNLAAFTLEVSEVTGPDATAIQTGLPAVNSGWTYRTFRSPGPVAGDAIEFMRVLFSE